MTCFRAPDLEVAMTFLPRLAAMAFDFEVALTSLPQLADLAAMALESEVALTRNPEMTVFRAISFERFPCLEVSDGSGEEQLIPTPVTSASW